MYLVAIFIWMVHYLMQLVELVKLFDLLDHLRRSISTVVFNHFLIYSYVDLVRQAYLWQSLGTFFNREKSVIGRLVQEQDILLAIKYQNSILHFI